MARQAEQDPTNLYIANLPTVMSENDLEATFKQYGNVISTRILRDNNGVSRGVGFCRMESKEKCEKIINIFNGRPIHGEQGEQGLHKYIPTNVYSKYIQPNLDSKYIPPNIYSHML